MNKYNIQSNGDGKNWKIFDFKTGKVLVSLSYKIDYSKYRNTTYKDKIPRDKKTVWSINPKAGAIYPTACANILKKSFTLAGHKVELKQVF